MYLYLLLLEAQNEIEFSGKLSFISIGMNSQKIDHNRKGQANLWVKTKSVSKRAIHL